MTGPTGGERATQEDIVLARCDRLPCWWRGSRLDTRPDCRVPAANGSGHILWTRRSNEGWPASCAQDDPSFATAVSTCSPVRKGAIASLIHRPRSWNGERGHASHPISPGGAFRGAVHPVCLNRLRGQQGAKRTILIDRCYAKHRAQQSSFSGCIEKDNGAYAPLSLRNRQTGMPICFALSARLS